jgi:hypothetical protein
VTGPVAAAEQAAESLRTVNHLTLRAPAPGTPGWEDIGDLYRVLGELRVWPIVCPRRVANSRDTSNVPPQAAPTRSTR